MGAVVASKFFDMRFNLLLNWSVGELTLSDALLLIFVLGSGLFGFGVVGFIGVAVNLPSPSLFDLVLQIDVTNNLGPQLPSFEHNILLFAEHAGENADTKTVPLCSKVHAKNIRAYSDNDKFLILCKNPRDTNNCNCK